MSQYLSLADKISFSSLYNYIFLNKIPAADIVLLNIADYEALIYEMRTKSEQGIKIPIKILEVHITSDPDDLVPIGQIQIVGNESS